MEVEWSMEELKQQILKGKLYNKIKRKKIKHLIFILHQNQREKNQQTHQNINLPSAQKQSQIQIVQMQRFIHLLQFRNIITLQPNQMLHQRKLEIHQTVLIT